MPLTENEFDWIKYVSGKNLDDEAYASAVQKMADREEFLSGMDGYLDDVRDEIMASQDLIIKNDNHPWAITKAWRKLAGTEDKNFTEMPWRATEEDLEDANLGKWAMLVDVEVDTIADIGEDTGAIDPAVITKLREGYEKALVAQRKMEMQIGADGMPLFTDDDIRKEVWTPLVRAGVIPDNIVPDKFSEHAIAFNGAAEFYEKKIEAFSATTTTGRENFKLGMKIAKESVQLAGTLTAGVLSAKDAMNVAETKQEVIELKAAKDVETDPVKKAEIAAQISSKNRDIAIAGTDEMIAKAATAVVLGGLSSAELVADHRHSTAPPIDKWTATIGKALTIAESMTVSVVQSAMVASQENPADSQNKAKVAFTTAAISTAFKSAKVLPQLVVMGQKFHERNYEGGFDEIMKIVSGLGDAIATGIVAAANKSVADIKESDYPDKNAFDDALGEQRDYLAAQQQFAAALKLGITSGANIKAIGKAIFIDKNPGQAAPLLVNGLLSGFTIGFSEQMYDGLRADMTAEEVEELKHFQRAYTESGSERAVDSGTAKVMGDVTNALGKLNSASSVMKSEDEAAELGRDLEEEIALDQEMTALAELENVFSEEGMQAMLEEVDEEMVGFEEMYSEAFPDPEITGKTEEELVRAQECIDRAMANTTKLRQRAEFWNNLTAGSLSVVAAIVPGAGLAVAVQKLIVDFLKMRKAAEVHNAWVDSMKTAFAARAGTAPAIENTLNNCYVHLNHARIKVVFDSISVGAETAKIFDPSGVSSIVATSNNMASAVVEFGYKMHAEVTIKKGWSAYLKARDNPGNRKAARAALRMNSTLAKCCIAYGASIMGDASAQNALRTSGLSVEAFKNDKDICIKLIAFLENELQDDPTVLGVEKKMDGNWHPGKPALTVTSWTAFKAAAEKSATPRLDRASLATPAIDRCLIELSKLEEWQNGDIFKAARDIDKNMSEDEEPEANALMQEQAQLVDRLENAVDLLERLDAAATEYKPLNDGSSTEVHQGMQAVAKTFAALARGRAAGTRKNASLVKKFPDQIALA
ncbi:hypothetical protein OS190_13345 [Sulfitobacter sp. F26204]|uniref:hypothetical protein n=1 Tax=Sulfitobacter sp. F26204 TaxID=2996014 RepID=UPI00225E6238|nr:hypothetical protein [Sulfitobacter sp. F26204]MCX7560556.1 hypothetical protein [Sulfitobacter sp. F26204]